MNKVCFRNDTLSTPQKISMLHSSLYIIFNWTIATKCDDLPPIGWFYLPVQTSGWRCQWSCRSYLPSGTAVQWYSSGLLGLDAWRKCGAHTDGSSGSDHQASAATKNKKKLDRLVLAVGKIMFNNQDWTAQQPLNCKKKKKRFFFLMQP